MGDQEPVRARSESGVGSGRRFRRRTRPGDDGIRPDRWRLGDAAAPPPEPPDPPSTRLGREGPPMRPRAPRGRSETNGGVSAMPVDARNLLHRVKDGDGRPVGAPLQNRPAGREHRAHGDDTDAAHPADVAVADQAKGTRGGRDPSLPTHQVTRFGFTLRHDIRKTATRASRLRRAAPTAIRLITLRTPGASQTAPPQDPSSRGGLPRSETSGIAARPPEYCR